MWATTAWVVVSTTTTSPACCAAMYSWRPFGDTATKFGVGPTSMVPAMEGTGTLVATVGGAAEVAGAPVVGAPAVALADGRPDALFRLGEPDREPRYTAVPAAGNGTTRAGA